MSFLKKLFGLGGGGDAPEEARAQPQEYEGFTILATPYKEGGQYQLCGVVSKQIDGQRREHRFIRADRFASMEDAVEMTLMKARQIVDQQGERIFRDG
ncbi:MAG: hypothetical protein IPL88_11130 [Rhizobiales bacterium]|nr:hypothetical protein [Hyphomicrobiales bacterium]